jgi:hypothetical protein
VFLTFGMVIDAILLAVGLIWCKEMYGRWQKDLAEYEAAKDPSTRQALGFLWAITAVVALMIVNFLVGLLRNLGRL